MKRLIEKGLMFGNLVHVISPVWIERYNRALRHLTGRETELTDFHIDISGYSPEVGDALGDDLYLNHAGVNRQFILLTTDQVRAPLLNAQFSTSRDILRQFIVSNEDALFALTARDAVAGEMVNSVFSADTVAQVLSIGRIEIEADTTEATVAQSERLGQMIDRFKTDKDAWFDDVLIAQMIGVAKQTGDVTRNPVRLGQMAFEQRNFWTSHFGGLYCFRGLETPTVVAVSDDAVVETDDHVIRMSDPHSVAAFLQENDLVEPIVQARGIDAAAILRQKMDFIIVDVAATMGEDLSGASRRELRGLARRYRTLMPEAFTGLQALLNWAENGGAWPRITSDHPAYFYSLRAKDHSDVGLVNMLLAEMAPLDIRQLFIMHKQAFYALYATWPEGKRAYVAEFLAAEYQVDKAGAREALFGHEARMEVPERLMVERVGPWGAVKRR